MQTTRASIDAIDTQAISRPMTGLAVQAPHNPLVAAWNRVVAVLAEPRRGATYAALSALSDRELRDIGLTRGEIRSVYDPEFCARRVMRARAA